MEFVILSAVATFAVGYLLGSIPFGLIFTRMAGVNLRAVGSGNIGATNVLRTGKKFIAFLTLLFDVLKAVAAVWITKELANSFLPDSSISFHLIAAVGAFLGHCFPIWLMFKGGKGVATYFGLLMILSPTIFLVCAIAWLVTFAITRVSSISSITIAVIAPVTFLLGLLIANPFLSGLLSPSNGQHFFVQVLLSGILVLRHQQNIARILDGTEPKFGTKT